MPRPSSFKAAHSPDELDAFARKEPVGRVRDRIRLIALLARGYTMDAAGLATGISKTAGWRWVRRYEKDGLASLKDLPRSGKPPKLGPEERERLRQRIEEGPAPGRSRLTGPDLRAWAQENLGVKMCLAAAYNELGRAGYSLQRPSARHEKNDPEKMELFKKEAPLSPNA